jgi:aryl carrier-like protein
MSKLYITQITLSSLDQNQTYAAWNNITNGLNKTYTALHQNLTYAAWNSGVERHGIE